jgi:hypothetical protein
MDDSSALASSADYADALLTARRTRSVLVLAIFLTLVFQVSLFFSARYRIMIDYPSKRIEFLKYLVGGTDFLGVVLPAVLAAVLLIIVLIMLLGRVLGVSHVVSSFISCIVLLVLLFPWQALLMSQSFSSDQVRIPGVLYTWPELLLRVRSHPDNPMLALLFWARFVGWPVAALALLIRIQYISGKGLGTALRDAARIDPIPNPSRADLSSGAGL